MIFSAHTAHTLLTDSSLHAKTALEAPDEPTAEMDRGAAFHGYELEGDANVVVMDFKDWRTKIAQESRAAVRAEGKTPMLAHQWANVLAMSKAFRAQIATLAPPIPFTDGVPEHSLFFTEHGVECRATPDWRTNDHRHLFDIKTTVSANPAVFSRTLWDKGYHLQDRLYVRAVKRVYNVDADFTFVCVEPEPPYAVSLVALDPAAQAFADEQLDHALAIWKRCLASGVWPGYPPRVAYAEVPAYVQSQFLERSYYGV